MHPLARPGLTAAQVAYLIRDAPAVRYTAGLELLDITLTVLADLTDALDGGSVSRSAYATLHGTASLAVAADLNWGTAILRPYLSVTDGVLPPARFNLGAYLTSSPSASVRDSPVTHAIEGFDILHWLNTPVGGSYVVATGTGYLAAAETILQSQGISAYLIDQTRAAAVLPAPRVWVLDTNTTWLNIVNDLLGSVGYQGLWSDWDGVLRMTPYQNPADRNFEWLYDAGPTTAMLGQDRVVTRDFFGAPNRWVFYTAPDPAGAAPVEGAGVYTFVNTSLGLTSVAARGRTITATPQQVEAVDQASLAAQAQARIDADLRLMTTYQVPTAPNPAHWHFDVIAVNDPGLGALTNALVTKWTLPLDGGDMTQEWAVLP